MDKIQEVRKTVKDYLSIIEYDTRNEQQRAYYSGSVLSARQKIARNMYKNVSDKIKNNVPERSIQDYLKKMRASEEYQIAFGLKTGNRDYVDPNLDLNEGSSSWS